MKVHDRVIPSVNEENQNQIKRINQDIVKEAIGRLKPNKTDSAFNMSSDFYIDTSPEFLICISVMSTYHM